MSVPLHFIGLLKSPVSWAKVGRESLRALTDEGARVSAVSLKGYLHDDAFPLSSEAEKAVAQKRLPGWDLALDYPPNFTRLNGDRKAGIVIYEADHLPQHWVEAINAHLDLAIVPSAFCMRAARASGVATKISFVPFGVDQRVFTPGPADAPAASGRSFNFLTVGAPHVRKGLKETVEAFCSAFPADRDVGLVVKCPPVPQAGRRPWEYGRVDDFLPDTRGGRITMLQGGWDDERMVSLYRACDVYVQASYGEAFGLAAVEAAACGKPVITTNWGAAGEIFDEKSAYLVDYDLIDASEIAYDWRKSASDVRFPPKMARPKVESLAAAMRLAYEDAALRRKKSEAALAAVRPLTWETTARGIIQALAD